MKVGERGARGETEWNEALDSNARETERERERKREGGESARAIANDLVVSSTPRRIRRTSNSSADRYWVPGGLARWGASAGGSGWKK